MGENDKVTILFSDIRDFTTYTAERGDQEAYRLVRTFTDLVEEQVERYSGDLVKTYGDGVMNTFPSPEEGLKSSIAMQRALYEHNSANPDFTISAGIGLNYGGAIREANDIFGHSVNVAARLAGYAKGGQIVVSSKLRDRAHDSDFQYLDLGTRELKGLGKHRLYELTWQDEIARITSDDNELTLVLTKDHLSIELSKNVQEEIRKAKDELHENTQRQSGLARVIMEKVEQYVDKYVNGIVDRALYRSGIGLDHDLRDIEVFVKKDRLVIKVEGKRVITLDSDEIDISDAEDFALKVDSLKSK